MYLHATFRAHNLYLLWTSSLRRRRATEFFMRHLCMLKNMRVEWYNFERENVLQNSKHYHFMIYYSGNGIIINSRNLCEVSLLFTISKKKMTRSIFRHPRLFAKSPMRRQARRYSFTNNRNGETPWNVLKLYYVFVSGAVSKNSGYRENRCAMCVLQSIIQPCNAFAVGALFRFYS